MDIEAYLERIGYRGSLEPGADTLRQLQLAHMLSVPFENLDIHLGVPITLDRQTWFSKIVSRRRGGFCYELNGLFAWLLEELGFKVTMIAAGVARAGGGFGPEFDHLALKVDLDREWLVDAGFGDSFLEPLLLDEEVDQSDHGRVFRITRDGRHLVLNRKEAGPQYRFTLDPHSIPEYAALCLYHQTSPLSSFTRERVCSIATLDGRVTLSGMRLIETIRGKRTETILGSEEEYLRVLAGRFGVVLSSPVVWKSPIAPDTRLPSS